MHYSDHKWSVVSGDFNSPFIRNFIWTSAFYKYPALFGTSRPVLGIVSRRNAIEYVCDMASWTKVHGELKAKAVADYNFVENVIDRTNSEGESFNAWTKREIADADLSALEAGGLLGLLREFIDRQSTLYALGVALPLLDFQGFSFVENNLVNFLKSKAPPGEYDELYRLFTEPSHNSYAQDQEEGLLALMRDYIGRAGWKDAVLSLDLDGISDKYPDFSARLREHTAKYSWVYYVYMGPAFTERQFLGFIRDNLRKGADPGEKLREIEEGKRHTVDEKLRQIARLAPDAFNLAILNLSGKLVWGKPRRKDYQSRSYCHAEALFLEIGRRTGLSLDDSRNSTLEMLGRALAGSPPEKSAIREIFECHACLPDGDGTVSVLCGKPAVEFSSGVIRETHAPMLGAAVLKGACACRGFARGTVKIVNVPADIPKMCYGDILVSTATTPSIVPAIRKAAAIVTDEGGLTCHASIVSREFGIPCVVGTKFATRVFRDGDLLEVDATKGVVRKV